MKQTIKDYLKVIYFLRKENSSVWGVDIAAEFYVLCPTVFASLKEQEKEGCFFRRYAGS